MVSDLRFMRLFPSWAAISVLAAAFGACASFGAEDSDPGTESPPMGAAGSGDEVNATPKTPGPSDPTAGSSPKNDVVDFGAVDCNSAVPMRTLITPIAPSDSVWNTTLEGTAAFRAQPASGMLEKGQAATFDVLAPLLTNIKTVEPITAKLTIALLDAADRDQVISLRVQPRGGVLTFATASLTFDPVAAVLAPTRTTTVKNNGNTSVTFTISSDNNAFAVTPTTVTLAPNEAQTITVKLVKALGGTYAASAVVTAKTGAICFAAPLAFSGTFF